MTFQEWNDATDTQRMNALFTTQEHAAALYAVVADFECLASIVEPRSHKGEWLALLQKARVALGMTENNPEGNAK